MTAMSKTETWIYVVNRSKYVFYASLHIILLFHENKQGVRMTGREGNISHDCPAFKVEASRFKRTILSCSSAKLPFDLSANVYSGTWNNKQTLVSNGSLLRASCCSREFHFNSFVCSTWNVASSGFTNFLPVPGSSGIREGFTHVVTPLPRFDSFILRKEGRRPGLMAFTTKLIF